MMQSLALLVLLAILDLNVKVEAANATVLFGMNHVLRKALFPALSVCDLKALRFVDRNFAKGVAPVLEERRREDKDDIEQMIRSMNQSMSIYVREFGEYSSERLANQCIDGFTGLFRNLIAGLWGSARSDDHLFKRLVSFQAMFSDYVANYGYDQTQVDGFEEFMVLHRQNQQLIKVILEACEGCYEAEMIVSQHICNLVKHPL